MRLASRTSPLAMAQAQLVVEALAALECEAEVVGVRTQGDLERSTPISQLAGRGVFVAGVQQAVLDGRADVAVHAAKDMRSLPTPGLELVGCLPRGDARDALVVAAGGASADTSASQRDATTARTSEAALGVLRRGATVATGSVRRQVQLAALRPDLSFVGLRGNIATRLAVVDEPDVDAVVVACAALERLGLTERADVVFDAAAVVPQAGQGAIALEVRADDEPAVNMLSQVVDPVTTRCVTAERAVLAAFGGGCDLPIGAHATQLATGELSLVAMVAKQRPAGEGAPSSAGPLSLHRAQSSGSDAAHLGTELAGELMAAAGYSPEPVSASNAPSPG